MIESHCQNLSYEKRLKAAGLIALDKRRERGDLIQVFKLIKGFDKVDYKHFFQLSKDQRTRGHKLRLVKVRSRLEIRRNFFSQRVVNSWNELPDIMI